MSEIKCSTVKITQKGISELDGNKEFIFIPRIKINSISLLYGCGVKRPLVQIILSLIFILVPVYFFIPTILEVLASMVADPIEPDLIEIDNRRSIKQFSALLLAFIPIGIWELYDVIKKKYYLLITTDKREKITFREKTTKAELKNFLEQAKENFGYEIEYSNLKPNKD
jgi:hypothetical protein